MQASPHQFDRDDSLPPVRNSAIITGDKVCAPGCFEGFVGMPEGDVTSCIVHSMYCEC